MLPKNCSPRDVRSVTFRQLVGGLPSMRLTHVIDPANKNIRCRKCRLRGTEVGAMRAVVMDWVMQRLPRMHLAATPPIKAGWFERRPVALAQQVAPNDRAAAGSSRAHLK